MFKEFQLLVNYPARLVYVLLICITLVFIAGIGITTLFVGLSLYDGETEGVVVNLSAPVTVTRDDFGVPAVVAQSRMDAFRALGYVTARDRLFQMDLLRRKSAGRLAEIFGEAVLAHDKKQRIYGFEDVAKQVVRQLPADQAQVLQAYADGVNSAIDNMTIAPFEFLLLGYRPDYWRSEDSLLIVLDMFETLNGSEMQERMLSVMAQALPPELYQFLTPATDHYTQAVLEEESQIIDNYLVPVDQLAAMFSADSSKAIVNLVQPSTIPMGSNAWAVSGVKTSTGRTILANDMHLPISVPNIWYRCQLQYGDQMIAGVNLPGTPLIVAGATRYLAWGPTTLAADILDLVKIEVNPDNPNEYRTHDGWKRFDIKREAIKVKGGSSQDITIKTTVWGPVSERPLLDQPVALRWTALDADAISLDLLNIDQVQTLEQGLEVVNHTGGPTLNMIMADHIGQVGWTTMGRVPIRTGPSGFDGSISVAWTHEATDWAGYITPEELPRSIDTQQRFVVSANNRSFRENYPYKIGHAFASGDRAYRISERLHELDNIREEDMLQLQLDTVSHVYGVYRDIALEVLTHDILAEQSNLVALRDHLLSWDGKAEPDSLGLGLIMQFRENLAKTLFEPLLRSAHALDADFQYFWLYLDMPLQALINSNDPRLLPDRENHPDWRSFLLKQLEQSIQELTQKYSVVSLHDLTWNQINVADYTHPLSSAIPGLGKFLDFPRDPLPGCRFCIRVDSATGAASMRLVVSPAYLEDGILHMPGGQSGHPFSKHYKDQHPYWVNGIPIPLMSKEFGHRLKLIPAESL